MEILDYRQCFDSMWMEEVINDLWEAGIQDDNLSLIARVNETVEVTVKTPFGKLRARILKMFWTIVLFCPSVWERVCPQKKISV